MQRIRSSSGAAGPQKYSAPAYLNNHVDTDTYANFTRVFSPARFIFLQKILQDVLSVVSLLVKPRNSQGPFGHKGVLCMLE